MTGDGEERSLLTLQNGARVVFDPRAGFRTATVGVWVRAGARDEPEALGGLAHFLEHMAFKGARGRSALEIAEAVEARGAVINASTEYERTGYFIRCMANDAAEMLESALALVFAPDHPGSELELEKGVVIQEIREAADQPEDVVSELLQSACYPDHPLGRPILGTEGSLRRITRDDLFGFAADCYVPRSTVVAVSGAFDAPAIETLCRDWLEARPSKAPVLRRSPREPLASCENRVRDLEQVHLALARPAPSARSPDRFAARAFSEIFGGGMASRLFQEVREKRGLAYSIDAVCDQYEDAGRHIVFVGCGSETAMEVAQITRDIWADLATRGPTEAEVSRAKSVMASAFAFASEATGARAASAAYECLLFDRLISMDETLERIGELTREDVRKAAQDALSGPAMSASCGPREGARAADWFVAR